MVAKGKQASMQIEGQTAVSVATAPEVAAPRLLPMFRVILHNDDENSVVDVVKTIVMLTPLNVRDAIRRMWEAHHTGAALLLVTHKERAELYVEQFRSRKLVVTIEPAD